MNSLHEYWIFTHYQSQLFCVRKVNVVSYRRGVENTRLFGDVWRNWCAERITEEQYFYAKKNKYVKIGGRPYGITISNKYIEVGPTHLYQRVYGLRQKDITCDLATINT